MTADNLPQTDSIQQLAEFWDTHDLTDFEEELEEVVEPVFEREAVFQVRLPGDQAVAIEELAKSRGLDSASLIREWVLQRMQPSS